MVDGRIDALDTPSNLKKQFNVDSMNKVFYQLAREAKRSGDWYLWGEEHLVKHKNEQETI